MPELIPIGVKCLECSAKAAAFRVDWEYVNMGGTCIACGGDLEIIYEEKSAKLSETPEDE